MYPFPTWALLRRLVSVLVFVTYGAIPFLIALEDIFPCRELAVELTLWGCGECS